MSKEELKALYAKSSGGGLLQTFLEDYEIDDAVSREWPTIPVATKTSNDDWFERWINKEPVTVEKKIIPKVDYIKCRALKPKIRTVIK